jgi:chalcone isomerase
LQTDRFLYLYIWNNVQISFATEGKDDAKIAVENENVAGMIQKWYLGGSSAVSPTTVRSLADHFAALLLSA